MDDRYPRLLPATGTVSKAASQGSAAPAGAKPHEVGAVPGPESQCAVNSSPGGTSSGGTLSQYQLDQRVGELVGRDLRSIDNVIRKAVGNRHPEIHRLSRHATALGGKRLRPVLAILAARAVSDVAHAQPQRCQDLHAIGASVELVHAASLVHDDVMDHAETRRHQPTVGCLTGAHAAILLGDYLFTKAYALAASCRSGLPARKLASAAAALCEGELQQQLAAGDWHMSVRDYRQLLARKTGALCSVSCSLGAWAGQHSSPGREVLRSLARFGSCVGMAFQICDDWLDYWGTPQIGKPLGADFKQRKPTLPLIRVLSSGDEQQRAELLELLKSENSTEAGFLEVRDLLDQTDASAFTIATARNCAARAIDCLSKLPDSLAKDCLVGIAKFSAARAA